jgi:hypothetical protein
MRLIVKSVVESHPSESSPPTAGVFFHAIDFPMDRPLAPTDTGINIEFMVSVPWTGSYDDAVRAARRKVAAFGQKLSVAASA